MQINTIGLYINIHIYQCLFIDSKLCIDQSQDQDHPCRRGSISSYCRQTAWARFYEVCLKNSNIGHKPNTMGDWIHWCFSNHNLSRIYLWHVIYLTEAGLPVGKVIWSLDKDCKNGYEVTITNVLGYLVIRPISGKFNRLRIFLEDVHLQVLHECDACVLLWLSPAQSHGNRQGLVLTPYMRINTLPRNPQRYLWVYRKRCTLRYGF